MTCEACRSAFLHEPKEQRAAQVHAAAAVVCGCEAHKASEDSPGLVLDSEVLHCVVSDPQHLLAGTGEAHPALLAGQIDKGGLSVLREDASDDEFVLTLEQLKEAAKAKDYERFFHGVFSFKAGDIRHHDNNRFMCVYDTAQEQKPHHADIMAPPIDAPSKSQKEKAQRARIYALIEYFGAVVPPSSFRGGAFQSHAREVG